MDHHEIIIFRHGDDIRQAVPMWDRINQFTFWYESGRLGKPRRIPKGSDLAPGLVARARAPIVTLIGACLKKERSHHGAPSVWSDTMCPSGSTRYLCPRQLTSISKKPAR